MIHRSQDSPPRQDQAACGRSCADVSAPVITEPNCSPEACPDTHSVIQGDGANLLLGIWQRNSVWFYCCNEQPRAVRKDWARSAQEPGTCWGVVVSTAGITPTALQGCTSTLSPALTSPAQTSFPLNVGGLFLNSY